MISASVISTVPVVETPRLRLRGHHRGDFEQAVALWASPSVYRFIGGKARTREETWARLLRYAGHWLWMKYGFWAVEEKATGGFIGEVGYAEQMRELEPSLVGLPEMGWVLAPQFHGRGYAREAVQAAQSWFAQHHARKPTCCIIDPDNLRSIHLAQKCGFREWQRAIYQQQPILVFLHHSSEPGFTR
jgi:RimJ/RimL family protein N-acetyltransferase